MLEQEAEWWQVCSPSLHSSTSVQVVTWATVEGRLIKACLTWVRGFL